MRYSHGHCGDCLQEAQEQARVLAQQQHEHLELQSQLLADLRSVYCPNPFFGAHVA